MISLQTMLLRLSLALLLGACVGVERERGERAAGLRTYALVAIGSCLAMIVSAFGFADILGAHNVTLDPSRIAAQVVSGIGFLGAGTILLRKEIIKGLTTAAAIWVVAMIGLACGGGLLLAAIATTILTLAILTILQSLRGHIPRAPETHHLRIKVIAEPALLNHAYDICIQAKVNMEQIEVQTGNGSDKMEITCSTTQASSLTQSLLALRTSPGLDTISVNLRNPSSNNMNLFPLFPEEHSA
jgi:putative Mg2+ transporter-C (MgtC) family protein